MTTFIITFLLTRSVNLSNLSSDVNSEYKKIPSSINIQGNHGNSGMLVINGCRVFFVDFNVILFDVFLYCILFYYWFFSLIFVQRVQCRTSFILFSNNWNVFHTVNRTRCCNIAAQCWYELAGQCADLYCSDANFNISFNVWVAILIRL